MHCVQLVAQRTCQLLSEAAVLGVRFVLELSENLDVTLQLLLVNGDCFLLELATELRIRMCQLLLLKRQESSDISVEAFDLLEDVF